jgi:MFS family permease
MSFRALLAVTMINMLGIRASRVLAPLFAIELGANPFLIGVLAAMDSVFPLLLALYAGKLSDRLGGRAPMMFGSLGMSGGLMVPYFLPSLPGLYLSAALIGLSHVFYNVSMQNLVGTLGTPDQRTRNFSNYSLALSFGSLFGPLLAGFAIDVVGHARGYLIASAAPLIALAILASQHRDTPRTPVAHAAEQRGGALELWRMPGLRRVFILGGVLLAGIDLFAFYMPIYGHSLGLSASVIGMVMSMFSVASFTVRTFLPVLARRVGEHALLAYAMLLGAAAYVAVPFVANAWVLGAVAFAVGFGLGCGMPLSMTLIYSGCPTGRSGEALGLRVAINNVMHIIVPVVFGAVGSAFGVGPVFWLSAALLGGTGWFGKRRRQQEKPHESESRRR